MNSTKGVDRKNSRGGGATKKKKNSRKIRVNNHPHGQENYT